MLCLPKLSIVKFGSLSLAKVKPTIFCLIILKISNQEDVVFIFSKKNDLEDEG